MNGNAGRNAYINQTCFVDDEELVPRSSLDEIVGSDKKSAEKDEVTSQTPESKLRYYHLRNAIRKPIREPEAIEGVIGCRPCTITYVFACDRSVACFTCCSWLMADKFVKYASRKDYAYIAVGTLAAIATGALFPIMFIFIGDITNSLVDFAKFDACNFSYELCLKGWAFDSNDSTRINGSVIQSSDVQANVERSAVWLAIFGLISWVTGIMQVYFWTAQANNQVRRIRVRYFRSVLHQEMGFFDFHSSGEINARLTSDIGRISEGIGDKVSVSIQMLARAVGGLVIGFSKSWRLTLAMLTVAPFLAFSAAVLFRLTSALAKKEMDAYAAAGSVAEEAISSIRTVVAFGGEEKESKRYKAHLLPAKRAALKKGGLGGSGVGISLFFICCTYGIAFWYGSTLVFDRRLTAGDMITCFFTVFVGAFSLGQSSSNLENFSDAVAAAGEIFETIDREASINSLSTDGHKLDSIKGKIEFDNVTFAYPSRPETQVLRGTSFVAEPGTTIGLCGESGCGKTTCIQLLQRLYDPTSGVIRIDGHDIRTLNVKWLRENIGVVSQEPVLFNTTISENIKFGNPSATDAEVAKAAVQANVYEFIMDLPKNFETLVGESGACLSGGQKQRIAIARATVRNPKILILDEATSSLDSVNEAMVQTALERASLGRTTVVISHRLSTIQSADKIVGLRNGVVCEEGASDELLKLPNGVYSTLFRTQFVACSDDGYQSSSDSPTRGGCSYQQVESTKREGICKKATEDIIGQEKLKPVPLRRIFALNLAELPYIIVGCFCAAISGGIMPCLAVILSEILALFEHSATNEIMRGVALLSSMFIVLGVINVAASTIQAFTLSKSGEEMVTRIRQIAFRAILRQEITFFDSHTTTSLTHLLSDDASRVQGCTGVHFGKVIHVAFSLGSALVISLAFGWQLALLALTFMPLLVLLGIVRSRLFEGKSAQETKTHSSANELAGETLRNIRTVVALTRETLVLASYKDLLKQKRVGAAVRICYHSVAFGFSQCLMFFAYAAIFRLGAYLVENKTMHFSDIFRVLFAIIVAASMAGFSASNAPEYGRAREAANRIFSVIDRTPQISSKPAQCLGEPSGAVGMERVSFAYPTRPEGLVLRDITLKASKGQTIAVVGHSGCGKSTCIQLLERFYDPLQGALTLADRAFPTLEAFSLRRNLGMVSQEPVLFNRSIAENIEYGDNTRQVPMDEIVKVAKDANIHDFIQTLPEGYETSVGEKGTQLSGGQRQRIAIARALLRNPCILLLDEATSSLDSQSEKMVQEALRVASKGRTCIVITHRLSTIQDADNIAVMECGALAEFGQHQALMDKRGLYYKLVNAQLQYSPT